MEARRRLITSAAAAVTLWIASAGSTAARPGRRTDRVSNWGSYSAFLSGVQDQALSMGVDRSILDGALRLHAPNRRVLELHRHQPEFTMRWPEYRRRVVSERRMQDARACYQAYLPLLASIWQRYPVDPRIVVAIWGIESEFGGLTGGFGVIDCLATLAFVGHRPAFFRAELLDALQILQRRDITPGLMLGSYAGAMGQPQFMPSSYLGYAVDDDGDGRRDIWSSRQDSLASIANYLARSGWEDGQPWGQPVSGLRADDVSRVAGGAAQTRTLGDWMRLGVRRLDGSRFSREDVMGTLLLPPGAPGEMFMIYNNFNVIKRYNNSTFYALAVGLLGSATS